jgi:thioredoxin 1
MNKSRLEPLNDANFYDTLQASHGVSIVFFSSEGCNSCRYWKLLLGQVAAQRPALRVYEVDAQQSMGLTQEYEVFHLPALFIFVDGHYHAPLQCEARLDTIEQALDKVLASPAQDAP